MGKTLGQISKGVSFSEEEQGDLSSIVDVFKKLSSSKQITKDAVEGVLSGFKNTPNLESLSSATPGVAKSGDVLIVNDQNEIGVEGGLTVNFENGTMSSDMIIDFDGSKQSIPDRFKNTKINGPTIQNIEGLQFRAPPGSGNIYKPLVLTYSQVLFIRSFFKEFFDENDNPNANLASTDILGKSLANLVENVNDITQKSITNIIQVLTELTNTPTDSELPINSLRNLFSQTIVFSQAIAQSSTGPSTTQAPAATPPQTTTEAIKKITTPVTSAITAPPRRRRRQRRSLDTKRRDDTLDDDTDVPLVVIDIDGSSPPSDTSKKTVITGASVQNIEAVQFTAPSTTGLTRSPIVLTYAQVSFLRSFFTEFFGDNNANPNIEDSQSVGETLAKLAKGNVFSDTNLANLTIISDVFKKLGKTPITNQSVEDVLTSFKNTKNFNALTTATPGDAEEGKVLITNQQNEIGVENGLKIDFKEGTISSDLVIDFDGGIANTIKDISKTVTMSGPTIQNLEGLQFVSSVKSDDELVVTYSQVALLRSIFSGFFGNDTPVQVTSDVNQLGASLAGIARGNVFTADEQTQLSTIVSSLKSISTDSTVKDTTLKSVIDTVISEIQNITALTTSTPGDAEEGKVLITNEQNEIGVANGLKIDFKEGTISSDLIIDFDGSSENISDRFINAKISGPTLQNVEGIQFRAPPSSGNIYKPLVITYSQILFLRSIFKDYFENDNPNSNLPETEKAGIILSQLLQGETDDQKNLKTIVNVI